ncbi:unnamed protein product [Danaus chrysippus]|uniref:(African queen) hypothetical protein n=1 Tax=Danaus chrysippus TaxID=151541 RepID=A0A8J2W4Y4_9NEOP|nr:unnamed protein product [Danaus chrysippus]
MAFWILALAALAGSVASQPNRIVGGDPTTIEQYPSIVQVEFQGIWSGVWSQSCGANIITTRTVISAAHCFEGRNYSPQLRRIRAGATYRNNGGQVSYVVVAYNHPSYNVAISYDGDITVVRLVQALVYNPAVAKTSIPAQGSVIPADLPVVHAGWGTTSSGGQLSSVLRDVTIYTVNNTLCAEIYANRPRPLKVTENMICAGILGVGGKDACQGDSGGPLYYGNITIGVVSWGAGCAMAQFPGVSTAIAPYTNWIIENSI